VLEKLVKKRYQVHFLINKLCILLACIYYMIKKRFFTFFLSYNKCYLFSQKIIRIEKPYRWCFLLFFIFTT